MAYICLHLLIAAPRFWNVFLGHLPERHIGESENSIGLVTVNNEEPLLLEVLKEVGILEGRLLKSIVVKWGKGDVFLWAAAFH